MSTYMESHVYIYMHAYTYTFIVYTFMYVCIISMYYKLQYPLLLRASSLCVCPRLTSSLWLSTCSRGNQEIIS